MEVLYKTLLKIRHFFHPSRQTLKDASVSNADEFAKECATLKIAQHNNVVLMLGVCNDDHLYLLMEYCSLGSLLSYLHKRRSPPEEPISPQERLWLTLQVCVCV